MSVVALLMLLVDLGVSHAQPAARRGEPNVLSTGYYVVDSDDDAPLPWRPNYFFVDTSYQPFTWARIQSGVQQVNRKPGYFFYNYQNATDPDNMDTTNNAIAGPLPIGFSFNYYDHDYDSLSISSNGFVGFITDSARLVSSPFENPDNSYFASNAKDLNTSASSGPRAIIAAMWADLDLIANNDSSKVYVRTSPSLDTFMINFYNIRLRPGSPNTGLSGNGSDKIFIRKFQIVLAKTDSSIQINYGPFAGALNRFPPVLAWRLFQNNVSIGLVNEERTQWTSVLYKNKFAAVNANCPSCNKNFRQSGQYALKFKRWKNIVRSVEVVAPTRNFEICLGKTSVVPEAKFQNVDLKAQTFKVRFQIRNVVTGIAVYGRAQGLINVPAQAIIDTTFSSYNTNPNILSQLGTFKACAIATTYDTADRNIGDRWPFDDTTCVRVFGIRTVSTPFRDGSNNYSVTTIADIPDQTKWISIGAQVVDGEDATFDPPPPRDLNGGGFGGHQYKSPVIRIDRQDIEGNVYQGSNAGDTLLSFPVNIQSLTNVGLSFDYQRSGRIQYPFLWDADVLFGPEHTVLNILGQRLRTGDSLSLEFKKPDQPACNPSSGGWTPITSIDGGHDFEFQHFYMPIQKANNANTNYFTSDFRFRLRLKAKYDGAFFPPPTDDQDDWYVDNLAVQVPRKPEIELMWVRVVNPYTKIPASQAVALPVYVKVANNSSDVRIAFPIKVLILGPDGEAKYNYTETITSLRGGTDSVIKMAAWNAQNATSGAGAEYTIHAWISQDGYDSYEEDNGTYTKFNLNVEENGGLTQEFAYDDAGLTPGVGGGNDVPAVTQLTGNGIGFGGISGSFASKFTLATKDTVYGVRVYFANLNQSPDAIRISLLNGSPASCTPGDIVPNPDQTGPNPAVLEDVRRGGFFNQFWPYYFAKPIVLLGGADAPQTKGNYWMSVGQLSLDNYMMGGDISRGGAMMKVYDIFTPTILNLYRSKYGTQAAPSINNGDVSCAFALEINASSGGWAAMMPSNGNWPFGGKGFPPFYNNNGTFMPMIRPLVGRASMLPIELLYLHGKNLDGAAELTWATASEKNNAGFYVERLGAGEGLWTKVGFVDSKVRNSDRETGYSYVDSKVTPGTYQYRLLQLDVDGTEHISNTVNVDISAPNAYALGQNYPNPFNIITDHSTDITYSLPANAIVRLEIYNALGENIRTLVSSSQDAGSHTVRFDGKDSQGVELANGTYLYRLTTDTFSTTRKMVVNR